MELKMTVDGLEKERDFYFGKLRDIEVMCQECDNSESPPIVQKILEVLYATEVFLNYLLSLIYIYIFFYVGNDGKILSYCLCFD